MIGGDSVDIEGLVGKALDESADFEKRLSLNRRLVDTLSLLKQEDIAVRTYFRALRSDEPVALDSLSLPPEQITAEFEENVSHQTELIRFPVDDCPLPTACC
jgi:hypothetical protein